MDDDMTDSIDDLLSELQSSTHIARDVEKQDDFKLDKEDLENFLLQYSGKLIKGSVDYVEDVKQFIKVMDIESKQALQQQDTETKLLLNREELMKQLIGDAQIIDADVTES